MPSLLDSLVIQTIRPLGLTAAAGHDGDGDGGLCFDSCSAMRICICIQDAETDSLVAIVEILI